MNEKKYNLNLTEEEAQFYYVSSNRRLSGISSHNLELLNQYYAVFGNRLDGSIEEEKQMNDYLVQIYDLSKKAWNLHQEIHKKEKENTEFES